jgi:bifunctional enzyme CysN/CysC
VHQSPMMPWYRGQTVVGALDDFVADPPAAAKPFRMPVQGVYRFPAAGHDRRIIAGSVLSGSIAVGDEIEFLPSKKRSVVATIEAFPTRRETAGVGDAVGITLRDQVYVRRGELAVRAGERAAQVATRIRVSIFWLGRAPFVPGKPYVVKLGTARTLVRLERISHVVDTAADSLVLTDDQSVAYNQTAECVLALERPIALDCVTDIQETSRFVIVDDHQIRGGGIVREVLPSDDGDNGPHTTWRGDTRSQLRAADLWLRGLSGAGTCTFAAWVVRRLRDRGHRVEHLDGDTIRDLFPDVGFDRASRDAHVRRVGHLASRLEHHGVVVVASFISPYASSRQFIRELCANFIEVHVATPLPECEQRDPKGLYVKARRGEI